jgi:chemotaxis methyl-accepting protein methylase
MKRQKLKQEKQEKIKSRIEKRVKASEVEPIKELKREVSKYSMVDSEKLREIIKRVQINISR